MSNIYIQEPPTTGKVVMKTSVGDIDLELWTKEAPKACRNFIQLCMEGYYDNTIFHRIVKGFIAQGGDPTGTGEGGESIYEHPFKDEFHTRLRFCRRGLLAMANAGKDDNGSQFFFTLAATPELQNKHTIFGKVTGETIYNMLKLEEALVDENDRPVYAQRVIKTEILSNPFTDIVPRTITRKSSGERQEEKQNKQSGVKNFNLLSFGEEAEEDEEESVVLNRQFSGKGKSAHDHSVDPNLVADTLLAEPSGPPSKKLKEDRSSDWESDSDDDKKQKRSPEEIAALAKEKEAMKERIKSKLRDTKKSLSGSRKAVSTERHAESNDAEYEVGKDETETIPYYLGKDREDERKKMAEQIKKEIRELKRSVQSEKRSKETDKGKRKFDEGLEGEKEEQRRRDEKNKEKTGILKEYLETQEKYKEVKSKMLPKGKGREDFTLKLLQKFQSKLRTAKESANDESGSGATVENSSKEKEEKRRDSVDRRKDSSPEPDDESWMTHALRCEDNTPVLAKDASTKDDDWFEIYDPRNPLNKRRRGEGGRKTRDDRNDKNQTRRK